MIKTTQKACALAFWVVFCEVSNWAFEVKLVFYQ